MSALPNLAPPRIGTPREWGQPLSRHRRQGKHRGTTELKSLPLHSPEMHARFGCKVELVSRLHIKRLIPSIHIAHGAINAKLRRAVRVREHALTRRLLMRFITPDLPIAHEQ